MHRLEDVAISSAQSWAGLVSCPFDEAIRTILWVEGFDLLPFEGPGASQGEL